MNTNIRVEIRGHQMWLASDSSDLSITAIQMGRGKSATKLALDTLEVRARALSMFLGVPFHVIS